MTLFRVWSWARFAAEELEAKKAAVLYDIASAYNQGIAEVFKEVFEENGGEVVAFEAYTTDETDFGPYLANIQASGADVLFLPNYIDHVPLQIQQARQAGLNIPIIGSDSWGGFDFSDYNKEFEGTFYSTHWHQDSNAKKSLEFVKLFQENYPQQEEVFATAALTFDAVNLILHAMETQNRTTSPSHPRWFGLNPKL